MPFSSIAGALTRRIAGGVAYTITLDGTAVSPIIATHVTPLTAIAGWRFNSDATYEKKQASWAYYADWASPTTPAPGSSYQIRATRQSGTETSLTVGNLNTWENLSSTITYSITNNVNGTTKDMVIKVEIRDSATQTIQDTGYYKISAVDAGP